MCRSTPATSTRNGQLHKGSPLVKVLRRACAAIETGRKVTPHGFRHTLNDLLRRDARAEVTRAIIGHSTERMTHHYSHVDEEEKRAAVARVFEVVRGGKGVEKGVAAANELDRPRDPKAKNPAFQQG